MYVKYTPGAAPDLHSKWSGGEGKEGEEKEGEYRGGKEKEAFPKEIYDYSTAT
jgi:hypothetical protein